MGILRGRINRRTFIAGNLLAGFLTVGAAFFLLAPIALFEILLPAIEDSFFVGLIEKIAFAIIAGVFLFTSVVLIAKRAHDFGSPARNWIIAWIGLAVIRQVTELFIFSLAFLLVYVLLCVVPGDKRRNRYGGRSPKRTELSAVFRY